MTIREAGSGGALGEFASEALGQALSQRGGFGIAEPDCEGALPFREPTPCWKVTENCYAQYCDEKLK